MNDEDSKSFVIKDRRRFNEEGELKDSESSESASEQVSKVKAADEVASNKSESEAATASTSSSAADGAGASLNFSSFIQSLALQALMQLGEAQLPEGVDIPIDRVAAKQTIEIIRMLQKKTEGNLDEEEARLIEGMLYELQMCFVRTAKK